MPGDVSSRVAVAYHVFAQVPSIRQKLPTTALLPLPPSVGFCTCFEEIIEDRKNFNLLDLRHS